MFKQIPKNAIKALCQKLILVVAFLLAVIAQDSRSHIVLTRDDRGQSLVLTGEDGGKGGKGSKGGGDGDQLVISGNNMGEGGQNSNMVMQDASNREGDVVISGNSMIVPGEDGHIVLADSRNKHGSNGPSPPQPNLFAFWLPYMSNRMGYNPYRMMPFGFNFGR